MATPTAYADQIRELFFIASRIKLNVTKPQDVANGLNLIHEIQKNPIPSTLTLAFQTCKEIVQTKAFTEEITGFCVRDV